MTERNQIDVLADFIVEEIPGEPSQSEGAGDCAIRLLCKYRKAIEDAMNSIAIPVGDNPPPVAKAYDLLKAALK